VSTARAAAVRGGDLSAGDFGSTHNHGG
jgi:hypothetical protein